MSDDVELDYDFMMQQSMRFFMKSVLELVCELGAAPGEHHFFIEFLTGADGVEIPAALTAQYPERMTIVLQHQFENLTIDDHKFGVTLWFKSVETRLEIPFDAVTSFADPSAQLVLRFDAVENNADAEATEAPASTQQKADADAPSAKKEKTEEKTDGSEGAEVVSLDSFRKK